MRILVVGGGGREHTLAWKLAGDQGNPEIFCAPGNAGTAALATNLDLGAEDLEGLVAWAKANRPDLTVVGPEAPLCAGLVDLLQAEGLRAFGPTRDAARLEGSKAFAKDVMEKGGVPTAAARTFTDPDEARAYLREQGAPVVIKADGLAAGKGVLICETLEAAEAGVTEVLEQKAFGSAGNTLLVEEFLTGEEASILALIDGEHIVLLASSQDHKRALNDDQGLNTGGMGAYSPAPVVTGDLWPVIREQVFQRTLDELKRRGIVFKGVLYGGLMIEHGVPKVLEFNVRFGDPEAQCVLPRMTSDLGPALQACIDGTLSDDLITWTDDPCVCVVMASGGYPGAYAKGNVIEGLGEAGTRAGATVFHAGTALRDGQVVTNGGRVLGVTATGQDLEAAIRRAYDAVADIRFENAHYRTDIAAKASRHRKPATH
jgi:phosphoribosylamine--glycine ligase